MAGGFLLCVLMFLLLLIVVSLSEWQPYEDGRTFKYSVEDVELSIKINIKEDTVYFEIEEIFVDTEGNILRNITSKKTMTLSEALENELIRECERSPSSFSLFTYKTYDLNKKNILGYYINNWSFNAAKSLLY